MPPQIPSSTEFLKEMKEMENKKRKRRTFFHFSKYAKQICIPYENYKIRTIVSLGDLDNGVYKFVEIIQDWRNKVFKIEDKVFFSLP
jgi:hypothetical protein